MDFLVKSGSSWKLVQQEKPGSIWILFTKEPVVDIDANPIEESYDIFSLNSISIEEGMDGVGLIFHF